MPLHWYLMVSRQFPRLLRLAASASAIALFSALPHGLQAQTPTYPSVPPPQPTAPGSLPSIPPAVPAQQPQDVPSPADVPRAHPAQPQPGAPAQPAEEQNTAPNPGQPAPPPPTQNNGAARLPESNRSTGQSTAGAARPARSRGHRAAGAGGIAALHPVRGCSPRRHSPRPSQLDLYPGRQHRLPHGAAAVLPRLPEHRGHQHAAVDTPQPAAHARGLRLQHPDRRQLRGHGHLRQAHDLPVGRGPGACRHLELGGHARCSLRRPQRVHPLSGHRRPHPA